MQIKLHEALSLPRHNAGYYETLALPNPYWGSVHHTVFYSTPVFLECQEELYKETVNLQAKYAKTTKLQMQLDFG